MRTLVLNAGYEPLAVVSFRRAVVLVLTRKATVVAESGQALRSPGMTITAPSVIALVRYVRAPRRAVATVTRRGVLRRDGHICAYCGKTAATVDHIIPRSRSGRDSWENLVACCLRCNGLKADRTPEEMGWRLRNRPRPPIGPAGLVKIGERVEPAWAEFLSPAA
ncbi:MAG: HNH endonuclease [Angustibacter sp.]